MKRIPCLILFFVSISVVFADDMGKVLVAMAGSSRQSVIQKHGKPLVLQTAKNNSGNDCYQLFYPGMQIAIQSRDMNEFLDEVRMYDPGMELGNGIRVGMKIDDAIRITGSDYKKLPYNVAVVYERYGSPDPYRLILHSDVYGNLTCIEYACAKYWL